MSEAELLIKFADCLDFWIKTKKINISRMSGRVGLTSSEVHRYRRCETFPGLRNFTNLLEGLNVDMVEFWSCHERT